MLSQGYNLRVGAIYAAICLALLMAGEASAKQEDRTDFAGLNAQLCRDQAVTDRLPPELWFPTATVATPSIHSTAVSGMDSSTQIIRANEQTLIPLPSGEWTGLSCLMGLALVRARKVIGKIFV